MAEIYLRRSQGPDLDTIMKIFKGAKKDGNPQQPNSSPTRTTLSQDIAMQTNWALIDDQQIIAAATLQLTPEPAYQTIIHGQWSQPNEPYAIIRRVAIDCNYQGKGLSKILFSNLLTVGQVQGIKNFRLVIHPNDKTMQHIAENFNFRKRGTIHLNDQNGFDQIAYELNLGTHHHFTRINNNFMQPLIDKL